MVHAVLLANGEQLVAVFRNALVLQRTGLRREVEAREAAPDVLLIVLAWKNVLLLKGKQLVPNGVGLDVCVIGRWGTGQVDGFLVPREILVIVAATDHVK